eukprot:GHVO01041925.1.p1 GENE.GHVO01041925.1~~GHVO01041925.1.p1  ORF type:complete len:111 (-),score=9.22 GHVO01041925.1:52-384(-)
MIRTEIAFDDKLDMYYACTCVTTVTESRRCIEKVISTIAGAKFACKKTHCTFEAQISFSGASKRISSYMYTDLQDSLPEHTTVAKPSITHMRMIGGCIRHHTSDNNIPLK